MAEDDDLGDLDLGEEEDDEVTAGDAEAFEEAISAGDDGDGDEELDPLAEEMLKMMEEEGGDEGSDSGEDVDQMMEMEMLKAMEEEGGGGAAAAASGAAAVGGGIPPNIERLMDVRLTVTIELGRTRDTIESVMEYGDQSLIELDKSVGEPVEVLVNGEPFARGEVVTVSENFGVRIIELLNPLTHN
jgi:flagellar motor switch protein FliN